MNKAGQSFQPEVFFKPHHYLTTDNNSSIFLLPALPNAVKAMHVFKTSSVGANVQTWQILIKNMDVNVILPTIGCYSLRPLHVFAGAEEADRLLPCDSMNYSPLCVNDLY